MKDPRSPVDQFHYLMSGTVDARKKHQASRCIHCDQAILSDEPVEGQPCLDCIVDGPPKDRA